MKEGPRRCERLAVRVFREKPRLWSGKANYRGPMLTPHKGTPQRGSMVRRLRKSASKLTGVRGAFSGKRKDADLRSRRTIEPR